MSPYYDRVLEVIHSANQRGGRMLSVIDLLNAETLSVDQLSWILERIELGSGWLVGARAGGSGKTTIMCALLAMLPRRTRIRIAAADPDWDQCQAGDCIVAYEIGRGRYRGYVWDQSLQKMASRGKAGCRIVSNLHADTMAEACSQIQGENGVDDRAMAAFGIFLPLTVEKRWGQSVRRVVEEILFWDGVTWATWEPGRPSARQRPIAKQMVAMRQKGVVEIGEVRRHWLEWLEEHPSV